MSKSDKIKIIYGNKKIVINISTYDNWCYCTHSHIAKGLLNISFWGLYTIDILNILYQIVNTLHSQDNINILLDDIDDSAGEYGQWR